MAVRYGRLRSAGRRHSSHCRGKRPGLSGHAGLAGAVLCLVATAGPAWAAATPIGVATPGMQDRAPVSAPSGGAGSGPVELSRLVRQAVQDDPEVLEARARMLQQGSEVELARASYLPRLGFSTRTEYNSVLERSVQVASVSASQLLHDFGRTSSAVEHAHAGADAEAASLARVQEDVAEVVSGAFLDWQRDRALAAEARRQVEAVERIAELTRQRGELGAAARSDVQQARARVEAARGVHWRLQADARAARRQLSQRVLLDASAEPAQAVPEAFEDACQQVHPEIFLTLPAIARASALREQAEAEMRQARAARWPRISLDLRTDHFFDSDIPNQTEHAVLLNISTDLYQGGATGARIRGAGHGIELAQARQDLALRHARQRWRDAAEGLEEIELQVGAIRGRLNSLEEVRGLYETQYVTAGSRSLLDLLNAEQEYFQARFDLLDLEHEQRRLQLDCLAAQGRLRDVFGLERLAPSLAGDAAGSRGWP